MAFVQIWGLILDYPEQFDFYWKTFFRRLHQYPQLSQPAQLAESCRPKHPTTHPS